MTQTLSATMNAEHASTTTTQARRAPWLANGAVLSAVRIVVSFMWVCHGAQGLFGAFGGIDGHGAALPAGQWLAYTASLIELVVGTLVLLGLFTRPAAVLCSGVMAFAYFTVHLPVALMPLQNGGEPAVLFCWIFLLIAVQGPGPFALDAVLRRRRTASSAT